MQFFLCSFVGANSPVLAAAASQGLHQASSHLQQLQAHLLRTSPYLSPQNSFIHAASYLPPPVALFGAASTSGKENIIEIEFIPCSMYKYIMAKVY